MKLVRDHAAEVALRYEGLRESGGPNRGPSIDEWLRLLGLPLGQPWCLAFVQAVYREAARELGLPHILPVTGKVSRFWRKAPAIWKTQFVPRPGAIFCHAMAPSDPESKGHCGIVVGGGVKPDGMPFVYTIEGNTNEAGAREGDGVMRKMRPLAYVNLGFVDPGRDDDSTIPGRKVP